MEIYEGFLTEKKLGSFLNLVFPEGEWINNKPLPNSGSKLRPDYRNDFYKIIVEYDGPGHYTNIKTMHRDHAMWNISKELGYTHITIPYFLQIDDTIFRAVFEANGAVLPKGYSTSKFPQGFIDKDCTLPASYCSAGLHRFYLELTKDFWPLSIDILNSLEDKVAVLGGSMVHPLIPYDYFSTED